MRFSIFYSVVFSLLVLSGCRDSNKIIVNPNSSVIEVPVSKAKSELFSDLFSNVRYVPLETMKESLITRVDKLIIGNSLIVVWDRSNHSILLFTLNGKFISRLGDQGKGPKEFVDILDVALDEENDRIILNDPGKQSLFYFDYAGNFLENKTLQNFDLSGPTFVEFQDYLIFNRGYYPIDENYLGVFHKNSLKFKESFLPLRIKSLVGARDFTDSFQKYGHELLYLAPLSNDVFKIDSSLAITKLYEIIFDSGNPNFDQINENKFGNIMDFDNYIKTSGSILDVRNFLIYGDYIYFNFIGEDGLQNVFYRRSNGEIKVVNGVKGDLDRYIWSQIMSSKGEELIGVVENPDHLFNLKITHKMPLNELASNPVLAFYSMEDASF